MTTKNSPIKKLQTQADEIARIVKELVSKKENGDFIHDAKTRAKLDEAKLRGSFKTGVVMDDKVLTIEIPWETVLSSSVKALSALVLVQMREEKPNA